MKNLNELVIFEEKQIRRIWHNEEWWFAIVDIIEVLTESKRPRKYWSDLKKKLKNEGHFQLSEKIGQLKMKAPDGKMRATDTANMETIFRIIQSIPSPKAEPFKQWLAEVGHERVLEIENPELIAERARQYYRDLGYSEDWITKRLQSIDIRGKLTDEWKKRGIKESREYSILTSEISKETFGIRPSKHKTIKGLKRENLRDHMTDLELIFTMLGETTTRDQAIESDAQGFVENKFAARKGGKAAGKTLKTYEEETGRKVVSDKNFKQQITTAKRMKRLTSKRKKKQ